MNKSVDHKLEAMSSTLMSRFSSLLENFQLSLNKPSFSEDSAVLGYSACQSEPPSLRPTVSTKSRTGLRFREGQEDPVPHESGLASASCNMDETPETVRHPPPGDTGKPQGYSQRPPEFAKASQSGADFDFQHEEDEDDDRESVTEIPPPDKTDTRLVQYIYMIDFLTHDHPQLHIYHCGVSLRNSLLLLISLQRRNRIS